MSIGQSNKLNRLLKGDQTGKLYFSSWLKKNGYSDQLLKQYRSSGWLTSLSKGVMYRTDTKLYSIGALASYNEQMNKSFYIGAHSALEFSGFNHYIPMGKPILMVGHKSAEFIPEWMSRSDFERELRFFSTKTFKNHIYYEHAEGEFTLSISAPEQAFLECLLLAPKYYSFMDLYYIMEQLTTLRPDKIQSLLECTDNIKVKRMFLYMSQKANHYWFELLDRSRIDLGRGKYQLTDKGVYISEYKITIPKEMFDYE